MHRPRGGRVRDVSRRFRPLLVAGLATMATAAGWPSGSPGPTRAELTAQYIHAETGASEAVLQAPAFPRSGSSAVSVAHLTPRPGADVIAPLRRLLSADVLVVAPTSLPP